MLAGTSAVLPRSLAVLIDELSATNASVRIPPATNVGLTPRVRRLLDTPVMARLSRLSQLGMVSLVYPGASHSRLEHSLGVYHRATLLLRHLSTHEWFNEHVDAADRQAFLIAALLHDAGHWPFCHPIEDMGLSDLPRHEDRLFDLLQSPVIADLLRSDWTCTPAEVCALLVSTNDEQSLRPAQQFLRSCLSGPVDVDKMDYLHRDSLHAGVPYGANFDTERLTAAMTIHPSRPRLAVGEKGRTAAELMVFARYVMFSEVYWHRTVRAATAMLQRSVFLLRHRMDLPASLNQTDAQWTGMLRRAAGGSVCEPMVEGLFGDTRRLYKCVLDATASSASSNPGSVPDGETTVHRLLARRPYWYLAAASEKLADRISRETSAAVHPVDVLIDAPPVKLEVDIDMDIIGPGRRVRRLADVSPVAAALAQRQFDDQVKRVRVFVRPGLRDEFDDRKFVEHWPRWIDEITTELDRELTIAPEPSSGEST